MARPDAPANVAATDGAATVVVTWDAVAGTFPIYTILRSPTADDEGYVIGVTADTSWLDATAVAGQLYWYRVRVRLGMACSVLSDPDSGYAYPTDEAVPDAPEGVMVEVT